MNTRPEAAITPSAVEAASASGAGAARLRWMVYTLLITLSIGATLGRILAVNSVDNIRLEALLKSQGRDQWERQRPFLSSNDRSRWATVRSLVEHGTYQIDQIVAEPNWDTIDMVKHDDEGHAAPGPTEGHLYSSKPPLLATLMAGEYWIIYHLTGKTLGTHPYEIGRFMLVTVNLLPLVLYFWLLAKIIERYGRTDWSRLAAMSAATFGTFLTTFAVVINNHLTAAVAAVGALYCFLRIWCDGSRTARHFVGAGFCAAFMAANELPALSLFTAMSALLLWRAPRLTLLAYLPAAVVVAAASFGTNYAAHGTLLPAYAERTPDNNWYDYQFMRDGKVRTSYWTDRAKRSPIDQGEPSRATYALHVLVGHHGIFSLTPFWMFAAVGMGMMCFDRRRELRWVAAMLVAVSLVCVAFYILRPLDDRNYGGMDSGFRWVFWFTPLWLFAALPALDACQDRRCRRAVALVCLGISALSVAYPTWNPWVQPWLYNWLEYLGWARLGG